MIFHTPTSSTIYPARGEITSSGWPPGVGEQRALARSHHRPAASTASQRDSVYCVLRADGCAPSASLCAGVGRPDFVSVLTPLIFVCDFFRRRCRPFRQLPATYEIPEAAERALAYRHLLHALHCSTAISPSPKCPATPPPTYDESFTPEDQSFAAYVRCRLAPARSQPDPVPLEPEPRHLADLRLIATCECPTSGCALVAVLNILVVALLTVLIVSIFPSAPLANFELICPPNFA
jgi:hypothetical protein